jgi:hypothetical protein
MFCGGHSWQVGPDLAKPELIIFSADDAEQSLGFCGAAVSARLSLHKDKFDVVLDDGVGFVGFAEESPTAGFIIGIGDLVPDDGSKVVEADLFAVFLYGGVQRNHGVPAIVFSARQADIADIHDEPATGDERAIAVTPNLVEGFNECVVIANVAKLILRFVVSFQRPVRRRCNDEVQRIFGQVRSSA